MKYEEAIKLWGAKKLRDNKVEFVEVTRVAFDMYDRGGCDSCGSDIRVGATVWYSVESQKVSLWKEYEFYGLDQILPDLFEASES